MMEAFIVAAIMRIELLEERVEVLEKLLAQKENK